MSISQHLLSDLIEEAKADEVGLWFIIGRVRDLFGIEDPVVLQATTLQYVTELLASGAVLAGYYKPDGSGVEPWDMEPMKISSLIKQAWDELGREPNIGDIVVFVGSNS